MWRIELYDPLVASAPKSTLPLLTSVLRFGRSSAIPMPRGKNNFDLLWRPSYVEQVVHSGYTLCHMARFV
jgi:hypothetical protein